MISFAPAPAHTPVTAQGQAADAVGLEAHAAYVSVNGKRVFVTVYAQAGLADAAGERSTSSTSKPRRNR